MDYEQARMAIKQRTEDIERQADLGRIPSFLSPPCSKYTVTAARYLAQLELPSQRKAFSLARCHVLPSAVLDGKYKQIPLAARLCPCDAKEVEDTGHVLLHCIFYQVPRSKLLAPLISKQPGCQESDYLQMLLMDDRPYVTAQVARFCAVAIKIRQHRTGNC